MVQHPSGDVKKIPQGRMFSTPPRKDRDSSMAGNRDLPLPKCYWCFKKMPLPNVLGFLGVASG